MSYAFTLNFKHCRSLGEALVLANKAADISFQHLNEQIEENKYWIPALQFSRRERSDEEKRKADDLWLERMMKMSFIWWPQHKLLALCGTGWPKEVKALFKSTVGFQNSCDQDYPFSDWKGLRSTLKDIVSECQTGDIETVKKYLNLGREEYPWDLEPEDTADEERFSYFRRSAAYNGIYETLRLDRWLWGHDDPVFMRFSITPLNSSERTFQAEMALKAYVAHHKNDLY